MRSHLGKEYHCTIAYFISPHGFGHAARSSAIMSALSQRAESIRFELFTSIPKWFFDKSSDIEFGYNCLESDVGLVQYDPFHEDLDETLKALESLYPLDSGLVGELSERVARLGAQLVICDIAPIGIKVANQAGIPSILVENFTWDWIYEEYVGRHSGFRKHIDYLRDLFAFADYHIQAEPVCDRKNVDLVTNPISRKQTTAAASIRGRLNIPMDKKCVVISFGGIPGGDLATKGLNRRQDCCFIVPGSGPSTTTEDNIILLSHLSDVFHPDLIAASDAVIGKVGYSTLAEVFHAGIPFGCVSRSTFRESASLIGFVRSQMSHVEISPEWIQSGDWLRVLDQLIALPGIERKQPNGADQAADFILELLQSNGRLVPREPSTAT